MKKKVHIFLRKPRSSGNYSVERMFYSLKKKFSNDKFDVVYKIAPFESSGLFKRFIICIWAIFNQGDVNHISGDINFLCIFLNKKKTITR